MALSAGDKAIIEQIAWHVGDTISNRIEERLDERIRAHQLACPASNAVKRTKVLLLGMAIGAAVVSSGGTLAALKLLNIF